MLKIKNLQAGLPELSILKGLSLTAKPGEIHAIMGPNGSGKSTLANVIAGHPTYEVTGGSVFLSDIDVLELDPEARAQQGIFLAFQYPASIPGVSVAHFLRIALNAQEKATGRPLTPLAGFIKELRRQMKVLEMPMTFAERSVNDGFSGGEKKRLEMLQMLILKPKIVILDEIDSGLDIDAIKTVADAVHALIAERPETIVLAITHYQRLLNYITPTFVHVVRAGTIIKSGGPELAHELEKSGYANI